jgi:hypothetical protein
MRHHLMREIGYKPFRCGHCITSGGYAEPSRAAMGKHFRMRHAGMTFDIHDLSEPERDAEVLKLLDSCMIDELENLDEQAPPTLTPAPRFMRLGKGSSRGVAVKPPTLTSTVDCKTSGAVPIQQRVMARSDGTAAREMLVSTVPKQHRGKGGSVRLRHCRHCSYTSPNTKALAQHVAVRHRPRRLRCAYCDHMTHYPSWLRKHARKSHPNLPFKYIQVSSVAESCSASISAYDESHGEPPLAADTNLELDDPALVESEEGSLGPEEDADCGGSGGDDSVNTGEVAANGVETDGKEGAVSILDGVKVRLPLFADSHGLFHCPDCTYQTTNRAHYKMHCMIHRPRKWQCFYCRLKFPLLFRLRHHYLMKHHGKPLKWIDVTTNKVCDDWTRTGIPRSAPSNSTSSSVSGSVTTTDAAYHLTSTRRSTAVLASATAVNNHSRPTARKHAITVHSIPADDVCAPPSSVMALKATARKSTARKSTSRSALRVAMFRCGRYFSIRRNTALEDTAKCSLIMPPAAGESADSSIDESDSSVSSVSAPLSAVPHMPALQPIVSSPTLRYCCHLCPSVYRVLRDFSAHLTACHPPAEPHCKLSASSPLNMDILINTEVTVAAADDDDRDAAAAMFLQRCGFCTYETFAHDDFEAHLSSVHSVDSQPIACAECGSFASFSELAVRSHFTAVHPGLPFRCRPLDRPYTMCPSSATDHGAIRTLTSSASHYDMLPMLTIPNILELTRWQLDMVLNKNGAQFCG